VDSNKKPAPVAGFLFVSTRQNVPDCHSNGVHFRGSSSIRRFEAESNRRLADRYRELEKYFRKNMKIRKLLQACLMLIN